MNTAIPNTSRSSHYQPHSALNEDQVERLGQILDSLLSAAESGSSPDVEAACMQDPDLAESIRYFMRSLQLLHNAKLSELSFAGSCKNIPAALGELGDFKLIREIGRGGMGIVYEAQQKSLARRVALKTLPFAAILDARQIARFQNEAQAAASLHHPNIVPVFSVGCDRGTHFYSMQYIDGTSLDHVIDQLQCSPDAILPPRTKSKRLSSSEILETQGPSTKSASRSTVNARNCSSTIVSIRTSHDIENIVRLIVQAARALHHAHQHGIVHRDIKPSNLLVNSAGHLWVTDFGLAQCRLDANGQGIHANLTRSGDFLGTLKYMSPEQALGKSILVDHRSDIYSLGVTLYELLTLQSVITGTDRLAMLQQISQAHPVEPSRLNAAIPTSLETIILKSLAKAREDRYTSAEELAEDLERFLAGQVPRAKRPTWLDHTARYVRQNPKAISGSIVVLMLMLAFSIAFATIIHRKNQQILAARDRANHHLSIAHEVVNRFGPRQIQQLELLHGSDEMRLGLAREAIDYFDSFVAYAANDVAKQRNVVQALLTCSELEMQLGEPRSCIHRLKKAITILETMKTTAAESSDLEVDVAVSRNNMATAYAQLGEFENAMQLLEHCLHCLIDGSSNGPAPMQIRACEVLTRLNLGHVAVALGDYHRGKVELTQAIALAAKLRLESSAQLQGYCVMRNELSQMLIATMLEISQLPQTPAEQSRNLIEIALRTAERLIGNDDCNPNTTYDNLIAHSMAVRDLNMCRVTLGTHLLAHGEANEALALLQKAEHDLQKLHARHPAVFQFQLDYATALNNIGQCELARNQLADAERVLCQSRDRLIQITASSDGYQALSSLGGVLNNLSIVSELRGDQDQALDRIRQAIEYQEQAIQKAPGSERCEQLMKQHQTQRTHLQEIAFALPQRIP